ncbi:MAG: histidine phosphatase family protein [bacterium]
MTETITRYIRLIRHAKSAEPKAGQPDFDRALNKRGRRDGEAMQAWFSQQPHKASWVWSSPAVRAELTAAYVTSGFNATFVEDRRLYLASADVLLDVLQSTPAEVESVAVVAHNPGLTHLANVLGKSHVTDNLVTFGTVLFATEHGWHDLRPGQATCISLDTPKTI